MRAMGELLTDDVGVLSRQDRTDRLQTSGPALLAQRPLRREAVTASLQFHPLAGGFALLSGTHRFYVQRNGKPESLDGQAEFTNLWQAVDGHWRMRRIYSYAHGAAAYVAPATQLTLAADILAGYAGTYRGKRVGDIRVAVEGDHLKLTAGALVVTLRAESPTRFFAEERDLRFVFAPATHASVRQLSVYENGAIVETATATAQ
ncbi:hypothetical protein XTPLMG730_0446 [Xanthomonas translucens pv. phlei]|uniref:DUF4440 domain-containing protein n=2 Tax=Xanthomonas translucens group TaxID=3390202 RepID=A0A0K2ZGR3_9XANT|nr:hypothetical protein XTPLMG730_0446 [Xanthomonas translucens pv. phlei]